MTGVDRAPLTPAEMASLVTAEFDGLNEISVALLLGIRLITTAVVQAKGLVVAIPDEPMRQASCRALVKALRLIAENSETSLEVKIARGEL